MGTLHLIPDPGRLDESLALAAEVGARFEYNDFYEPSLLDDEAALAARIDLYLAAGRDRSSDTLHGAFYDVTVHSDDPLIRTASEHRVLQSMEVARALGVRGVVFHTGTIPNFENEYYERVWLERNAAFWRDVAARFPGIEILMENMFDMRPDFLESLAKELEDLPGFGVCLDCAHAAIFGRGTRVWAKRLEPYIRHLHINDHDGKSDLHLAVGAGVTDWAVYDSVIRALPQSPSVLIETKDPGRLRDSLAFMKERHLYPFD